MFPLLIRHAGIAGFQVIVTRIAWQIALYFAMVVVLQRRISLTVRNAIASQKTSRRVHHRVPPKPETTSHPSVHHYFKTSRSQNVCDFEFK